MVRNKASLLRRLTCLLVISAWGIIAQTLTENKTGTHDGFDYELWFDNRGNVGTGSMTLTSGGTFSCQWQKAENFLARKGKKFNETQTYRQIGDIKVEYSCDYNPQGNSYMCVYGWTVDPLVEFYIVENYGTWRPPGGGYITTVTIDGESYDIYKTTRTNQPSIKGTATFDQYWSVCNTQRTSGIIPVSKHFRQWKRNGLKIGKMNEVAFCIEGYQSSGSATITKQILTIGKSTLK
jgi:endo-1,4-beta-xylanase